MREIKFRARFRKISNGKECWQVAQLIKGEILDPATDLFGYIQITEWEQYTGLKDKDGKGIYEGDIIAGIFVWGAVSGEVYFDKSVAAFGIKKDMLFDAHDLKNFEIKGNIHENPELIS